VQVWLYKIIDPAASKPHVSLVIVRMATAAQSKARNRKEHVPLYNESQVQIHPEATVCQDAVFKGKVTIGRGERRWCRSLQMSTHTPTNTCV